MGNRNCPEFEAKVRIPSLPPDALPRRRLLEFLHANIDRRPIAVSAPAGYGKTTLLAQFAHEAEFPVCWFTLDRWDAETGAFLENIVWALRQRFPDFGDKVLATLSSGKQSAESMAALSSVFLRELQDLDDYFALVIDDCHHIDDNDAIRQFLYRLVAYPPEQAHLVLTTRTKPPVPSWHRFIANRRAASLAASELKFTDEEARSLVQAVAGREVPQEELEQHVDRCDGWAAALVLSTQERPATAVLISPSVELFEYLAEEVLAHKDDRTRDFLLKTSVLPLLRPGLCDALLRVDDSRDVLTRLAQTNLVTEVPNQEDNEYRYHSLTREFLQRRFQQEQPLQSKEMWARGGTLLEQAGLWQNALECYGQAEAWDSAADLVLVISKELSEAGRWAQLAQAIDDLPGEVLQTIPELLVLRARAHTEDGKPDEALRLVGPLINGKDALCDPGTNVKALVVAGASLRLLGRPDDSLTYLERAQEAVSECPGEPTLLGEILHSVGITHAVKRNLEEARRLLESALEVFEPAGDTTRCCRIRYDLGNVCTELGEFGQALAHYDRALRGLERLGNQLDACLTLNNLGAVYYSLAEYGLAKDVLLRAVSLGDSLGLSRNLAFAQVTLGDVCRALCDYDAATEAYRKGIDLAGRCGEVQLLAYGTDGLAQTFLRSGESGRADVLLDEALALAEQQHLDWQQGLFSITVAQSRMIKGMPRDTQTCLERAVQLLEGVDAPLEASRARLHLANVWYARGRKPQALAELNRLATLLQSLPSSFFLVSELLHMPGLLDFAVGQSEDGGVYLLLRHKVEEVQSSFGRLPKVSAAAAGPREAAYPPIEARALGASAVAVNGRGVTSSEWRSARARELFFFLAYASRPLTKEEIIANLWPDETPQKANSSFRCSLFRARRALYTECLRYADGYYRFDPKGPFRFDVDDFRSLIDKANRLPKGSNLRQDFLTQAVSLYKGPLLPEFYSEWCEPERRRLEDSYVKTLATLAGHAAGKGDHARAAALYERILDLDAYDEDALGSAILSYARAGDREASVRIWRRARELYENELGSPLPKRLEDLYPILLRDPVGPGSGLSS